MPTASFKRLKEWSRHFLRNDFKLEIGIENNFKNQNEYKKNGSFST